MNDRLKPLRHSNFLIEDLEIGPASRLTRVIDGRPRGEAAAMVRQTLWDASVQ